MVMTTSLTSPLNYATIREVSERFGLNAEQREHLFGISRRNQARYQKTNPKLNPLVADRVRRFQRLTQQAIEVFEDESKSQAWLSSPKDSLNGLSPFEAIATDDGAVLVEQMLTRIEYGVYG